MRNHVVFLHSGFSTCSFGSLDSLEPFLDIDGSWWSNCLDEDELEIFFAWKMN